MPDYVYRIELTGPRAHAETRARALDAVKTGALKVQHLTLDDVARIAALGPRRSAGLGELACAILAERSESGVLIDDRRAQRWLVDKVRVRAWHDTETVLIDAAHRCEVTEYELSEFEGILANSRYTCRVNLRNEYLMQRLARHACDISTEAAGAAAGVSDVEAPDVEA
jgi:hypothetical protein